jgi:hypothetical protein
MRRRLFAATLLVMGGLLSHGSYAGSGDEPHYLAIAHSLAFDRDLDLANNYGAAEPLIAGGGLQPELHALRGAGGIMRPVHDVGMPLLFAPYVFIAGTAVAAVAPRIPPALMKRLRLNPSVLYRNVIASAMILVTGVLALWLFNAFGTVGLRPTQAFWTTLLVILSPPLLIHGILFFTEITSACLCLFVFRRVALDEDRASAAAWAVTGAAAGLLLLVHVRNLGLVVPLVVLAVDRLRRTAGAREVGAFAASVAAMAGLRTALTHHMWGTWLMTPHARAGEWTGATFEIMTAGRRLAGLLLDQEYGLLPYAPIFLLVPLGVAALARLHRPLVWKIAFVAACYLLTVILPAINVHGWTGGWSPPARFLVPIVPLLALAVAAAVRATPAWILVPVVVAQLGIDAYVWQHPKLLWNDGDGVAAICARGAGAVCAYLPSFVDREAQP